MRFSSALRNSAIALTAIAGIGLSTAAQADTGYVHFNVVKGGWFVGAQGGNGTLTFHGKRYPISIGGVSGLVFGGSATDFTGRVTNIRRPTDITGVYGAAGAGGALIVGGQVMTLRNEKGAQLNVSGKQVGLQVNADLSGLAISMP